MWESALNYMSTLLNQAAYAKHRGVSTKMVSKYVAQGLISTKNGKIDPVHADKELEANLHPSHRISSPENGKKGGLPKGVPRTPQTASVTPPSPGQSQDHGASFASSRAAKEFITASLKKIELEEKRGQMINAEELKAEFAKLFVDIKTRIRAIGPKIAQEVAHLKLNSRNEKSVTVDVQKIIMAECDEALKELSNWGQ